MKMSSNLKLKLDFPRPKLVKREQRRKMAGLCTAVLALACALPASAFSLVPHTVRAPVLRRSALATSPRPRLQLGAPAFDFQQACARGQATASRCVAGL